MKVVAFVGSPRKKGNTAAIVDEVLRGVADPVRKQRSSASTSWASGERAGR